MHDALGDPLAVEVLHLLEQLNVLHQQRAARSGGEGVLIVGDRRTARGGEFGVLRHRSSFARVREAWAA